ncbi:unnamed protein product [Rotaria magnacalcarata]|uniref:Uncharacterized protein n=1 Tax=Rotaria magnacalcarata TaxID=392030 RepID=A0A814QQN3_9BILA|nr:unnamed protein product [Rotaria magnacalcarata]CAF1497033.1 unnamed protein product [Rotaria magnacalcarata]CAF1989224.1 unnamed protein product [Rotaria magnacalcarata]CAF3891259.1 unnamed protein product [Rotaria magnacalcarata]CAF3911986.1 unnamed protein product [Rotaria magnacalcarata]
MNGAEASGHSSPASGKSGEKKDRKFLSKTVDSVRDKVHRFTGGLRDKAHNLRQSKNSNETKTNANPNVEQSQDLAVAHTANIRETSRSNQPPASRAEQSNASSTVNKPETSRSNQLSASRSEQSNASSTVNKPETSRSNQPPASRAEQQPDTTVSTQSRARSEQSASNDSPIKPSNEHKDVAISARAVVSKRSAVNSNMKTLNSTNEKTKINEATNALSSEPNDKAQVHISFLNIYTVDDVFERLDEAIEEADIDIDGDKGKMTLHIETGPAASKFSTSTAKKKRLSPGKKEEKIIRNSDSDSDSDEDENPIIIDHHKIHTVEDLLLKLDNQARNRRVVLKNESHSSDSIDVKKPTNPSSIDSLLSTVANKSDNVSSAEIAVKSSTVHDDQINVNVESGVDHLDRKNGVVQPAPMVIDKKKQERKKLAPLPPSPNKDEKKHGEETITTVPKEQQNIKSVDSITNHQNIADESSKIGVESNISHPDSKQTVDGQSRNFITAKPIFQVTKQNRQTLYSSTSEDEYEM